MVRANGTGVQKAVVCRRAEVRVLCFSVAKGCIWWKTIPHSLVEPPVLTWSDFLREFRQKWVPDAYVDMKL